VAAVQVLQLEWHAVQDPVFKNLPGAHPVQVLRALQVVHPTVTCLHYLQSLPVKIVLSKQAVQILEAPTAAPILAKTC